MPRPEIARRRIAAGLAFGVSAMFGRNVDAAPSAVVHLSPSCGCCRSYVQHLRRSGFSVRVESHGDLEPIKRAAPVPAELESCHTVLIEGFTVEGHVPAAAIHRLLAERPRARGSAVPGIPAGSPGMEGGALETYDIVPFRDDGTKTAWITFKGANPA